ncbi:MAG: LacI family transcriptional regulator [Spirochaetia bacterium]|nr:LacI family transcriptional regulator [Spirochaetia bacterium]
MSDIAKEAGVGLGTVSRVFNNDSHVSDETKSKVLSIAHKYKYTPNIVAAKLARNSVPDTTIGILLPDIGNHFYFEIFEVIYREIRKKKMNLLIFNYEKHNEKIIRNVLESGISILLIFNFKLDDTELDLLKYRNIEHLYVSSSEKEDQCIYTDNLEGGRIAAQYLLGKKVCHPCYIADKNHSKSSFDRFKGFSEVANQNGITDIPIFDGALEEKAGRDIARIILHEQQIDGVFCYCDEIAAGVIEELRNCHVAGIHVIGFDGLQVSRYIGFSTVSQDPHLIACEVVVAISRFLNGKNGEKVLIQKCIRPFLVDRNS